VRYYFPRYVRHLKFLLPWLKGLKADGLIEKGNFRLLFLKLTENCVACCLETPPESKDPLPKDCFTYAVSGGETGWNEIPSSRKGRG
jgi:hypothetical protein